LNTMPYFDSHCDTLFRAMETGEDLWRNGGHLDLERLSAYRPMGQIFAIFFDSKGQTPEACMAAVRRQVAMFTEAKKNHPALMERCFLSLEGAEQVGCDENMLGQLYDWGCRWINLTWNNPNALSGSCVTGEGLSEKGRSFVRKTYEKGMFVDVSHLSDKGFWELCEMECGPIVASHSNARRLCGHARNLTDDMAKEIFRSGGFLGVNFCNDFLGDNASIDSIVAHVEHFLALGGENHLGMGSDFDGADVPEDISGVQNLPKLWETLRRRNYSETLIEKLAYGNLALFLGYK